MIADESRLVLPRRPDGLRPLLAFAREKAGQAGFSGRALKEAELAVEEMAADALEHAPGSGPEGPYEVVFERTPGQLVIAVEDRCAPFDMGAARKRREAGLALLLVRAFADEVRFLNLGQGGKRVEVVKNVPAEDVGRTMAETGGNAPPPQSPAAVEIRPGQARDCVPIAQLCYRATGRGDGREFVYFPERLREQIAAGSTVSRVAVDPSGRIVGACLAVLGGPDARVAVAGPCFEDPRSGLGGLPEKLLASLFEGLRERGVCGLLSEFPESAAKDAFAAFDAAETALLLGHWPPCPPAKGQRRRSSQRRSVLLGYLGLSEGPRREVFPPFHHAGIVERIYRRTNLNRLIHKAEARRSPAEVPPGSRVDVEVKPSLGQARLAVRAFGQDILDHLFLWLEDFDRHGVEVAHLDLPLSDPGTGAFAAPVETLGFSFAGVIPELYGDDVLRLQRLAGRPLAPPSIQAATEFGTELARYVWSEYRSSSGALSE